MQRSQRFPNMLRTASAALALLGVTAAPSVARADLADSLAATSVEHYPSAQSGGQPSEPSIHVFRASVGAPLPIGDETTLIVAAAYEYLDVQTNTGGSLELHAPKATFGIMHDFSGHWGALALVDAGLASDFSDEIGSDDLLLSLTGIVTYRVNDSIQLGAGAVYDRRTGKPTPLPAVLLSLRLSERVRIRGFAPVWLNAEYRAASWLTVGVRSTLEGNRFHVASSTAGVGDVELAYSNLTVGPKLTFSFTDWTHLDVYAAGAVYRRYEVFQDDDRVLRNELSPVLGYGVRLWVGPPGW